MTPIQQAVVTAYERQAIAFVLQGCTNKTIAERMRTSEDAIKQCLYRVYNKVGVNSRLQLVLLMERQRELTEKRLSQENVTMVTRQAMGNSVS